MGDARTLILGGTNKGGTTSVFSYLSAHPQVAGSKVKETAFFISRYTDVREHDEAQFASYFSARAARVRLRVEASTGYLAHAPIVAERIRNFLASAKLLFVLRAPPDRLYSYFNFQKSRLLLPPDLSFEKYVNLCLDHQNGRIGDGDVPFDFHHLQALHQGNYSLYLDSFFENFSAGSIKLAFFEDLVRDPRRFMDDLCAFAGIDSAFYRTYDFDRINATFSSKHAGLHRIALMFNERLERLFRQRPALKRPVVAVYKRLNMASQGYGPISPEMRRRLREYYGPDVERLASRFGVCIPENWREP